MSFLRKASMKLKPNEDGTTSPSNRSVSSSSSRDRTSIQRQGEDEDNTETGSRRRKPSLAHKGRKRLSSLFSSHALSSQASGTDSTNPARRGSTLGTSISSSGTTTPTREMPVNGKKYPGLGVATSPTEGITEGVNLMGLGPPVASPTEARSGGILEDAVPKRSSRKEVVDTEYSRWVESDEDTSDEELAFRTPSEGLSEVEEDDEDESEEAVIVNRAPLPTGTGIANANTSAATGTTASDSKPTPITSATTAASTSSPGSGSGGVPVIDSEDVLGTGPSTMKRTKHARKTQVVRHLNSSKESALSINQDKLLAPDLDTCREALTLFLTSQMQKAEELCTEKDPDANHLYLLSAGGIIQALKGMMTFDSNDLGNALEITRGTAVVATALRKPSDSIVTRLGGLVKAGSGVPRVKLMTNLERHAELVYAETSLMKALLAIIAGGDWLGLVKEALNMRTAHGIYRTLQQYVDEADKDGFDEDIDMDFRSGVLLGTGTSSLMLSLLPGKVLKIAEVFGYAGDRKIALETLMAAGGWHHGATTPDFDERNEGLRRPICDMILLTFHLVISVLMPVAGVDIPVARAVLEYNMKRYPDGVFFLYFQARLHTSQCEPDKANESLQKALNLDLEYVQLQHMCLWDYACNFFMLGKWKGALDCFYILKEESNWSRAVYTYAAAAALVELVQDNHPGATKEEALKLMDQIPSLTKKIAGKSLPIEKLCSRKARKFHSQNHRLFLPAMELAYVFGSLSHTPRKSLLHTLLPRIDRMLATLEGIEPGDYGNGHEYWDDYTLGHFLRGVVQFTARYQPPEASAEAKVASEGESSDAELDAEAEKDFLLVLEHAPKVELDHYVIYHCHFELGKLYAARNDNANAKKNFDIVMSGKVAEGKQYQKAQGKYSLEGALLLKTHAAQQKLKEKEKGIQSQAA